MNSSSTMPTSAMAPMVTESVTSLNPNGSMIMPAISCPNTAGSRSAQATRLSARAEPAMIPSSIRRETSAGNGSLRLLGLQST